MVCSIDYDINEIHYKINSNTMPWIKSKRSYRIFGWNKKNRNSESETISSIVHELATICDHHKSKIKALSTHNQKLIMIQCTVDPFYLKLTLPERV